MKKTLRLTIDLTELEQFFLELREQSSYPLVKGDPLLLLYDLLCTLGIGERTIYSLFGVRGYLHVARNRFVKPAILDQAIAELLEMEECDEEG